MKTKNMCGFTETLSLCYHYNKAYKKMGAIKNPTSKETKAKRKASRPSRNYTQADKDKVCQYIEEGLSLRKIAAIDGMPSMFTINVWRTDPDDTSFHKQYVRAKKIQSDLFVDEINDLAAELFKRAEGQMDEKVPEIKGKQGLTNVTVNALRELIKTRQWTAARFRPDLYGDSIKIDDESERTINVIIDTDDAKA